MQDRTASDEEEERRVLLASDLRIDISQQRVERGGGQFQPPGEFIGTRQREARTGQRDVERPLALAHRARRGVIDRLAEPEILEEAARIGLA